MSTVALRPAAAAAAALICAGFAAVALSSSPPAAPVLSPSVDLVATADAFEILANGFDPSAASDGLLPLAASADQFLDLFGNPTVNIADTLATDFLGYFQLPGSVSAISGQLTGIDTDVHSGFSALSSELTTLTTDLNTGFSTLATDLGQVVTGLGTLDTGLDTINTSINTLDDNINSAFSALDTLLGNDLSPLGDIAADLGQGGAVNDLLSQMLAELIIIDVNTG